MVSTCAFATMTLRALAMGVLCACCTPASGGEARSAGREAPALAGKKQPARGGKMDTLSKETLEDACTSKDAAVVLARVERARIGTPGTRSESAFIGLRVERTICGTSPPSVEVWRYTSGGDTVLRQGKKYVVTIGRGPGPVPYGFGDFVLVPEGREGEAVETHLQIVRRIKPSQP